MVAILLHQSEPLVIELYFYATITVCFSKPLWLLVKWVKMLYIHLYKNTRIWSRFLCFCWLIIKFVLSTAYFSNLAGKPNFKTYTNIFFSSSPQPCLVLWGETGGSETPTSRTFYSCFPPPSTGVPTSLFYFYCKMLCNMANFFYFSPGSHHFLLPPQVPLPPPILPGSRPPVPRHRQKAGLLLLFVSKK